jgi:hypothetical protein
MHSNGRHQPIKKCFFQQRINTEVGLLGRCILFGFCAQIALPGPRVGVNRLVLIYRATNVASAQKDQSLLSLKWKPFFKTHSLSWKEKSFIMDPDEPKTKKVLTKTVNYPTY